VEINPFCQSRLVNELKVPIKINLIEKINAPPNFLNIGPSLTVASKVKMDGYSLIC